MAIVPWWCCCTLTGDCPCASLLCSPPPVQTCKLVAYWDVTLAFTPDSCGACAHSLWCGSPPASSCGSPVTRNQGNPWSYTHTSTDLYKPNPGDCAVRGQHAVQSVSLDSWILPCIGASPPCEYKSCFMVNTFASTLPIADITVEAPSPSNGYIWRATCSAYAFGSVTYETGVRGNCTVPDATDWTIVSNTLVNLGCHIATDVYTVTSKTATLGTSYSGGSFDLVFVP
jgi:hypothetical protein